MADNNEDRAERIWNHKEQLIAKLGDAGVLEPYSREWVEEVIAEEVHILKGHRDDPEPGEALTPREEFEAHFGIIIDQDWQWLKEFVQRSLGTTSEERLDA